MKQLLGLTLALAVFAQPARAYVDGSPTLGRIINEASTIVVLQVDKVSVETRAVLFRKVADIKGNHAGEQVKHLLADTGAGRWVVDWASAEPEQVAILFHNGKVGQVCIGRYWYECTAGESPWWSMTSGRPELSY